MKKINLVLCALLLTAGVTKAGEYVAFQPSEPVAISWKNDVSGRQLNFKDFLSLSEGDMVKIHVTNIATDCSASVNLQVGDSWQWVDIPNVTIEFNNGIISFPIQGGTAYWNNNENYLEFTADDLVKWIKERGLIVNGSNFKVLDITVQSNNVADDGCSCRQMLKASHNTSNNNTNYTSTQLINSGFKYTSGDYITATVSLNANAETGEAWFQVSGGGNDDGKGWVSLKEGGEVKMKSGDAAKNVTINIKNEELEAIHTYGLALNGLNTTVTNIVYHYNNSTPAGYRPVYIPASGYATFFGTSPCELPDGVSAYYVSSIDNDNDKAITSQLHNNIPANQGVILEGTPGIYQLYPIGEDAENVSDNLLHGAVTRTLMDDVTDKYVLYNNSGTPEFRKINAGTYLDPFKAYLNVSGAEARIALSFDNETNGIDELKQQTAGSKQMFDLQGRRVAKSTRGLYIVNGKKVFVK